MKRRSWYGLSAVLFWLTPGLYAVAADSPLSADSSITSNMALRCIMHVHSHMSSGRYSLEELTQVASTQRIDVICLSDELTESIQYGLWPLRHIFWMNAHHASILRMGPSAYLEAIRLENERQTGVLYIPGAELVPRFYWSDSIWSKNLTCNNHQRNLIVLGIDRSDIFERLPVTCGYLPCRDTAWIVVTRILGGLLILSIFLTLAVPKFLSRRSGYAVLDIRLALIKGVLFPIVLTTLVVNLIAALNPAFDLYGPDKPEKFEQGVIDSLRSLHLPHFWAHPEASDNQALQYHGFGFTIRTNPYPELLLKTHGYTGFAGVNEGENKLILPGSLWDAALNDYVSGRRTDPAWCFGEMLYHYEGQAGKRLSNVETIVWSPAKRMEPILDSIHSGRFYARENSGLQSLILDQWQVGEATSGQSIRHTGQTVEIKLQVSSAVPGETVDISIIRNGGVIRKETRALPCAIQFQDQLPDNSPPTYYRALIQGRYPLSLVSNPIFVNLMQTH